MFEKKVFLLFAIATAIAGLAIGCSCEEPPPKPDPTAKPPPAAQPPPAAKPPPAAQPAPAPRVLIPTLVEELKNEIEIPAALPKPRIVHNLYTLSPVT